MLVLLGPLFALVAAVLLIVTIILVSNGSKRIKNTNECTGVITGFYTDTSNMFLDDYERRRISPIISYTVEGKSYEFVGNYYDTTMKEGQNVKVLYDKEDCTKASIKTGVYLAPIITGALTVLFGILASAFIIVKNLGLI